MELLIQILIVVLISFLVFFLSSNFFVNRANSSRNMKKSKDFLSRKENIIKIVIIIAVSICTLLLTNNYIKDIGKNSFVNNFEDFVVKVGENYKEYSDEDWEVIDQEYLDLIEVRDKYEDLLTDEDSKRISKLQGKYLSYQAGNFIDDVLDTTKDVIRKAANYIDGFIDGFSSDQKDTIEMSSTDKKDTIHE